MKVDLITYNFLGSTHGFKFGDSTTLIGGQEIYTYDLASYLTELGHDVTIITTGQQNETLSYQGIIVKRIRLPLGSDHAIAFNFFFRRSVGDDVAIKHLMLYLNSFPFAGKDMTGSYHGVTWDDPEMPFYKKRGLTFLNDAAIKRLDRIAACDNVLLKYTESKYPELASKIHYIPNYVRTDIFNSKTKTSETLRLRFEGKKVLLCPRNLTRARGVDIALEAFRMIAEHYPDLILVFVGDGPLRGWIQGSVKKYGLQDRVYVEGHKDHFEEMPSYYAASDIVLVPSRCSEGESLSCLEAQSVGKPVVTTDTGGLADIVIDEYNGIVSKPDAPHIMEGIRRLLEDPKLRSKVRKNGFELIASKHTYRKWCESYRDFFRI